MRSTRTLLLTLTVSLALGSSIGLADAQSSPGPLKAQTTHSAKSGATSRWPGHRPGKLYLGMSCGTVCSQKQNELGHSYGVHRQFEGWGNWSNIAQDIRSDHAAGRLPWISFKPPLGGDAGWRALAAGNFDAELRNLARTLKANDNKPVLITLHHEPSNDGTEAQGIDWARAYCHLHHILRSQGALANVADPPIVGDWLFNAGNKTQDPDNWVTHAVLKRAPFLGIDLYENAGGGTFADRLPHILKWMAARGFPNKMVGIGETGSTDGAYPSMSAIKWMNESLNWAVNHTGKVGVVSYFNSTANSRSQVYWPLDESSVKTSTFRGFLNDPRVIS